MVHSALAHKINTEDRRAPHRINNRHSIDEDDDDKEAREGIHNFTNTYSRIAKYHRHQYSAIVEISVELTKPNNPHLLLSSVIHCAWFIYTL